MNAFAVSEFSSSWGWPVAASIGGIIVFIGLLLEKIAECKNERFSPPLWKPYKILGECGWVILMIGIAAEIVVGFALAWKDEKDISAAKNAERNAPISVMTATAFLIVAPTNITELTNLVSGREARLTTWKDERWGTSLETLIAESNDINEYPIHFLFGTPRGKIYRMQFSSPNLNTAEGIEYPVKILDDIHLVHIDLNFLPRDTEIVDGSVELVLNSEHKMFEFPRQNDTNSTLSWEYGFPFTGIATNGVTNSERQFLYLR
jgi:hypothetical protein